MFRLTAKIEIESAEGSKKWAFDKVVSIEITRDMDTLTDKCIIKMPQKVEWKDEQSMPLRRGDKVKVSLGYNDDLQLAFTGNITSTGLKPPIEITCEDYMLELKKKSTDTSKSYRATTIDQILADQMLDIKHNVFGDQHIGSYRVPKGNIARLLDDLREKFGVLSFIRYEDDQPVLYAGVSFAAAQTPRKVFATGVNLISDANLKVQSAEDVKIKVKGTSLMPNNKVFTAEEGDPNGEERTLKVYNKTEPELKEWVKQEYQRLLQRLKYDGLVGSFTTFGAELLDKLDNVGIIIDGQRKGVYQVKKNVIKYSKDGFRQEVTIEGKTAE